MTSRGGERVAFARRALVHASVRVHAVPRGVIRGWNSTGIPSRHGFSPKPYLAASHARLRPAVISRERRTSALDSATRVFSTGSVNIRTFLKNIPKSAPSGKAIRSIGLQTISTEFETNVEFFKSLPYFFLFFNWKIYLKIYCLRC